MKLPLPLAAMFLRNAQAQSGGSPPAFSVLASVNADGWSAVYNGTPPSTTLNEPLTMTNVSGFDSTGVPTTRTISSAFRTTRRLRSPGLTTLSPDGVAVSLRVPAGASIAGTTNSSTAVVPVPIVNWVTRDQQLIGDEDLTVEIVAGHYYGGTVPGEQIACAEFVFTPPSGPTLTKKTSTMVLSTQVGDQKPVYVYRATVTAAEMTAMANGVILIDCNVFPFVGTSPSVARTSDSAARGFPRWKFAQRNIVKDPVRRANPPRCYLSTTGSDASGVWSVSDTTARGAPFLTMAGAFAAAKTATIPAGDVCPAGTSDGCEVRAMAGTFTIAVSPASFPQYGASLIMTRDPLVSKAAAIYEHNVSHRLRVGQTGMQAGCEASITWRDVTYNRTANVTSTLEAFSMNHHFENVAIDFGGFAAAIHANNGRFWYWGNTTFAGVNGASTYPSSGGAVGIMRGVTGDINLGTLFGYNVIGCSFSRIGLMNPPAASMNSSNTTICYNVNTADTGTTFGLFVAALGDLVSGHLMMGNSCEWTSIITNPISRLSGDSDLPSTSHLLEYNNTYAGYDLNGRHNDKYVDSNATATRTHQWARRENNIYVQYNTKHDLFLPVNAARVGGWEHTFGTGTGVNWSQFLDAGNGEFAPEYQRPNSQTGTSRTVALSPLFKNNRATIDNTTPGLGGGDYRLQRISEGDAANSPCLTLAEQTMLPGFGSVLGAWP